MSILSLTSDFGEKNGLLSIFKTKMITKFPNYQFIEYTNQIDRNDFLSVATYISRIIPYSPKGSIHFLLVNTEYAPIQKYVLAKKNEQYIIAPNNGLLSLIDDIDDITLIAENIDDYLGLFNEFIKTIEKLAINQYPQIQPVEMLIATTSPIISEYDNKIFVTIIDVDKFGNLITDLKKDVFFKNRKKSDKFEIMLFRENFNKVNKNVADVRAGETAFYFNTFDNLEIGVNQGNASRLLGFKKGNQFRIIFKENKENKF